MSLINDALKKAQKQREIPVGTPPPGLPPQTPLAPASSPAPSRGNNFTLLIAAAAVLVSGSVAATVYFLRAPAPHETAVTVAPAKAAPVQAPTPAPAVTAPSATAPVAAAPATTPATKSSAPATTPAPVATVSSAPPSAAPPSTATTTPSVSFPASTPAPTAAMPASAAAIVAAPPAAVIEPVPRAEAPPLKATYRIQGMIDKFRISGIRLSDTDSKVILNDHLFRINDLVEPSLGLRLTKIETHLLSFTDAEGNVYLKHF